MFSGFFFAKSVSEGEDTSMEYGKFPMAVKDQEVFKKSRRFLEIVA